MARTQLGLNYIEKPSAAAADYTWRLFVASYFAVPVGLLYLVFGDGSPVNWPWIATGIVCLLVAMGDGVFEMIRTMRSRQGSVTEPLATFLMTLALFTAILALNVGVPGSPAPLRWLLLTTVLVAAVVGNRLMFAIMAVLALSMMAFAQIGVGVPIGQVGIELLVAVILVTMFRTFAIRVVAAFARDLLFGTMSEVAATVDSLDEGWDRMLPAIAAYIEATDVIIARFADGAFRPVVSWPAVAPPAFATIAAQLGEGDDEMATEAFELDECIVAPVVVASGAPMIAVVVGAKHRLLVDMYLQSRMKHVVQQVGVLVNRIQMIEGLELLTRTDSLTGLPNRRALTERLAEETDVRFRRGTPLCAVMVDLDHFKSYNDQFGHLEGDRALETVGAFMSSRVRARDMVARYGGEEFAMILPETDVTGALELLDEIRGAVRGLDLCRPLTISVGIARWEPTTTSDTLLSHADQALYQAKSSGRDQCRVWEHEVAASPVAIPTAVAPELPRA